LHYNAGMEQNFHKLYSDIVKILRRDYAGMAECVDSFTPRYYTQAIGQAGNDGKLDDVLFLRYVNQMLACTGDRHLRFERLADEEYEPFSVGFSVRRFGDELIVTAVTDEERLAVGDRITAINGGSPAYHRSHIEKNFFYADEPEREDWTEFLSMAESIDIAGKGYMELRHFPLRERRREPSVRFAGSIAILTPAPFDGTGKTAALVEENAEKLAECERIIWDLRQGEGCDETEIEPLLPWLITVPRDRAELLGDTELYVNYTLLNCSLRAQQLAGLPEAQRYIEELRSKAGAGYIPEKEQTERGVILPRIRGTVTVLTDTACRDAGEAFVLAAKRAGAKLIGRPTMGTLDYCGDVSVLLGERFVLSFPTAVTVQARNGAGMKGRGIEPDVRIPYTPGECRNDSVLAAAMEENK